MKYIIRIALVAALLVAISLPAQAQGQLRAKFKIFDNKTKEPIAGVKIVAFQPERPNNKWEDQTNEEGEFVIAGLSPGVVIFELTKDGYQNARFNRRMRTSGRNDFEVGLKPIIRPEGQATPEIAQRYAEGVQASQAGNHEEALGIFMELIEKYPDIKESYLAATTELSALGRDQEAIDMLKKILEENPDNGDVMLRIAESYVNLGETEKATEWYEKLIEVDPTDTYAIEKVAASYYANNKFEEAIKYYNMAIELSPENAIPHYYLGSIYYAEDNFEKAIMHFEKYMELDPDNSKGGYDMAKGAIADMKSRMEN